MIPCTGGGCYIGPVVRSVSLRVPERSKRRWGACLILSAALFGCTGEKSENTGLDLTVRYDSLLEVVDLAVFGTFDDGTPIDRVEQPAPFSLDPPGLRAAPLMIELGRAGQLELRVDGMNEDGVVLGSARRSVSVEEGRLAPVDLTLGAPVVCGDGRVAPGVEDCDDGNTAAQDGCSTVCMLEPGWRCEGSFCARCGDGRVELSEQCDDGNLAAGDGCSPDCTTEGPPPPGPPPPPPGPPPPPPLPAVLEVEQLQVQTTTAAEFVDVPGATLAVRPLQGEEAWLVFASGRMRSTSEEELSSEMRMMVDGEEVDRWGHQTMGVDDNWAGFVTFELLPTDGQAHEVRLQYRTLNGETEVGSVRLVATVLPEGSDVHYATESDASEVTGVEKTLSTLEVSPNEAGVYVVLAKSNVSEAPGANTAEAWLEDPQGARFPSDENGSYFSVGRAPWAPMFVATVQTLEQGVQTFKLGGTSSGEGDRDAWWSQAWSHRAPLFVRSATITPDGYAMSVTFDHAAMVSQGLSLSDGTDVRMVYGGESIERALDPSSQWNDPETTVWFRAQAPLPINGQDQYWLYYGNTAANMVPDEPGLIFPFYDDFEQGIDMSRWMIVNGQVSASQGELTIPGDSYFDSVGAAFGPGNALEARVRLSATVGNEMRFLALQGQDRAGMSFFVDGGDHHAQTGMLIDHFLFPDVLSYHDYAIERVYRDRVVYRQDGQVVATHTAEETNVPGAQFRPLMVNTSNEQMFYDWVRVRPLVFPEPEVSIALGMGGSIRGGSASTFAYQKMIAFRADAFDMMEFAASDAPMTTTSTVFSPVLELETEAPTGASEYVVIQALRVGGPSDLARKSGALLADDQTLLQTSHRITRDASAREGYHHIAGVVDARKADTSVRYQNGALSLDGISVRATSAVIVVLRHPAAP